ncbi:MAG: SAM-dependent methyltransferase [Elusimicrobiota bacterium]|jgi:SAM-dependent MidA family methyltransferase
MMRAFVRSSLMFAAVLSRFAAPAQAEVVAQVPVQAANASISPILPLQTNASLPVYPIANTDLTQSANAPSRPSDFPALAPISPERSLAEPLRPATEAGLRPGIWDVLNEVSLDERVQQHVPESFDSFQDYMDKMLYAPRSGYYTSGRVLIGDKGDFTTYPTALSPDFGRMLAEQAYRMWDGMRQAGDLSETDRFTVAEFGGGNGLMARDFLEHVRQKQHEKNSSGWAAFADQVQYVLYERSPELRKRQKAANAQFGDRFRSATGDARDPLRFVQESSLKGLVVSNELPDAFGVHKVLLSKDGKAEAAFVVPQIEEAALSALGSEAAPKSLLEKVRSTDRALRRRFGFQDSPGYRYLDKKTFGALMRFAAKLPQEKYRDWVRDMLFQEVFIPASLIPALAAHIERNASEYAAARSKIKENESATVYMNVAADGYIEGVARMLKSGYAMTIDYGNTILELISTLNHFRTYKNGIRTNNPYFEPSLDDMTTDQNFTALAKSGAQAGLMPIHFGPQGDLAIGLGVGPKELADHRRPASKDESSWITTLKSMIDESWLHKFVTDHGSFKILVQQKKGTDPAYVFPAQKEGTVSDDLALGEDIPASPAR